jgi:xanthine dehydrogenase/oxidase
LDIPLNKQLEYVEAYKQSRRRDDDIAILSCCFRMEFEETPKKDGEQPLFTVKNAVLAYGGMAVKVVTAPLTQAYLAGKAWNKAVLPHAYEKLAEDLPLAPGAPGGMIEYRRSLTTSFFFKFYLHTMNELYAGATYVLGAFLRLYPSSFLNSELMISLLASLKIKNLLFLSITAKCHEASKHSRLKVKWLLLVPQLPTYRLASRLVPTYSLVIYSLLRLAQVTGEAVYTDDIPTPPRGLYAAFVLSSKAHAEILRVDPARALESRGVVAYIGADDIPGANQVGPVFNDEELFATKEVHSVGFTIGVVVADTHQNALDGAKLVHVEYKELPHVITIEVTSSFSTKQAFQISHSRLSFIITINAICNIRKQLKKILF